jgi:ATP-dependent RNA helicase DHX34
MNLNFAKHLKLDLFLKGALTNDEHLTPMGKMLSNLPVDISIGKMLVLGSMFHQVEPILSLAAALSVQNPFTNKAYRDPDCQVYRAKNCHKILY